MVYFNYRQQSFELQELYQKDRATTFWVRNMLRIFFRTAADFNLLIRNN
jgi:hypothetical protein